MHMIRNRYTSCVHAGALGIGSLPAAAYGLRPAAASLIAHSSLVFLFPDRTKTIPAKSYFRR
jgi:hypothetical protein